MAAEGIFGGAAQGAMAGSALGPWGMVGGAVIGGLSGLLGGRSAKRQRQEAERMDQQRRAAYSQYGQELTNLGSRYGEEATFRPVGVRTQFGRTFQDPETGEMVSELDPRYAARRGQFDTLFNQEYERLQGFDPEKLAADRYGMMQRLVAGNRAEQMEGAYGTLLRKGLLGGAARDGSGRVSNPLVAGLQRGYADEDTKLALEAMNFADQRRLQGLGLLSGLQGQVAGIDMRGNDLLSQGYNWSGMTNAHRLSALGNEYGMYQGGLNAMLQSRLPGQGVSDARNAETAGRYGMYQGMLQGAGQFIPQIAGGLFGSTPPPIGPMPEAPGEGTGSFVGRF